MNINLTPELISLLAGTGLSLVLTYIPFLNSWFIPLKNDWKRLILLGFLGGTSALIYFLGCWGFVDTGLTCDRFGAFRIVTIFLSSLVANQAVYPVSPGVEKIKARVKAASALKR